MLTLEKVKIPLNEVEIPLETSLDEYAESIKRKINFLRIYDRIMEMPDVDAKKVKQDAMGYFFYMFTIRAKQGFAALVKDENETLCYIINPNFFQILLDEKVLDIIGNMDNMRIFVAKQSIFLDDKILTGEVKLWN